MKVGNTRSQKWHLFDLDWSSGCVTLPNGRVINGHTALPPSVFHGRGASPRIVHSGGSKYNGDAVAAVDDQEVEEEVEEEAGPKMASSVHDDEKNPLETVLDIGASSAVAVVPLGEVEAALGTRPPAQSLPALIASACWFVIRANMFALCLAAVWAVPALVRLATIKFCLRLPRSARREWETGKFNVTSRLYHMDTGPEMSWLVTGGVVGLTLSFAPIVWTAVYGFRGTRGLVARWVPSIVFSHIFFYIANFAVMYRHLKKKYVVVEGQVNIPSFLAFPMFTFFTTRAVERMIGLARVAGSLVRAYMGLLILSFAYFWVIPRLWFASGMTDAGRVLIRLLVHPLFFETANFLVRVFVRSHDLKADPSKLYYLVLPGAVLNGLYGRFLVSTSSSTLITVVLAVLLSLIEITLRLSVGARDRQLSYLGQWIKARGRPSKAARESTRHLFSTTVSKRLRADMVALEQVVENASIITASFLVYVFEMSTDGAGYTVERALTDAGIQLLLEAFTDVTVTVIEERWAGVPIIRAWETRHGGRPWAGSLWVGMLSVIFASYFAFVFVNPTSGWTSFRDA